ncbi:bifunctional hydroxymethylpyrimidine kinase/phosphomethylpyrimidine kinase [Maricaulis sp. D1M11]|uniref:bifunctional hydroxymethylpyrimidine kinase/phosphomethylpyrimidine kinase n=1 Tax=Maricaulis sp. D1M11 TaxID=3076117 RepID=UPI0039B4D5EA
MTEMTHTGRVLSIAGSDSSGGAGIQADIKAISAMGGYAMTAVTAVTVQNTQGVSEILSVPADMVAAQMKAVIEDIGVDAIKTGMLGSVELIETVANTLSELAPDVPLIVDPVMVATSGDALIDEAAETALREVLLPRATLVTPNIAEAERLADGKITDLGSQIGAGETLVEMGAMAALVKGGHLKGGVARDVLISGRGMELMEREKLDARNTHGTGCTLASAIATLVGQGHALSDAAREAGDYVHEAIRRAPDLGQGHGPVDHFWMVRQDG